MDLAERIVYTVGQVALGTSVYIMSINMGMVWDSAVFTAVLFTIGFSLIRGANR
jgi:hypothetical protein